MLIVTGGQGPRDHLRVCGADGLPLEVCRNGEGSPPRVRSRRCFLLAGAVVLGITSACAEQTPVRCPCPPASWDHLRVCGADKMAKIIPVSNEGSPPRVRSRPERQRWNDHQDRITSACAEQTSTETTVRNQPRDHLRVCGADPRRFPSLRRGVGSPPRVRSRRGGKEEPPRL